MKPPTPNDITRALDSIEVAELAEDHHRRLAREAIARHRRPRVSPVDPNYDFNSAPRHLRQTIYDMTVKYSAQHSWWSRLRRR